MFLGAGSAATGIAQLLSSAFQDLDLSVDSARKQLWMVDVDGLVTTDRQGLSSQTALFAQDQPHMNFLEALDAFQPDVLIGATGSPGSFNKTVIEKMASFNDRPVIFALSNPTSRAECTAEEVYQWSGGRALFASGSPFWPGPTQ